MTSHRLGFSHELLVVNDDVAEPWRIVKALDAAVFAGGRHGAASDLTPMLWAMAAERPIVAEENDVARDLIEDGTSGILVPAMDTNAACARLVRLHEDRTAAARLGEEAANRMTRFSMDSFCERLRREYEAIARR